MTLRKMLIMVLSRINIKGQLLNCVNSLNSKEMHVILVTENVAIPSSQEYYNNLFIKIYILLQTVSS